MEVLAVIGLVAMGLYSLHAIRAYNREAITLMRNRYAEHMAFFASAAEKRCMVLCKSGFKRKKRFVDDRRAFEMKARIYIRDGVECLEVKCEYLILVEAGFTIKSEGISSRVKKIAGYDDVLVGHSEFDDRVHIEAVNRAVILSILDYPIREKILLLTGKSFFFEASEKSIHLIIPLGSVNGINAMKTAIHPVIDLAKNTVNASDLKNRLLENMKTEPCASVKINVINELDSHFPGDPEVRKLFKNMTRSNDSMVRVEAAKKLGNEGFRLMMSMLKNNIGIDNGVLITVINHFSERKYVKSIPVMKKLFEDIPGRRSKEIRMAILYAFRSMGSVELNDFLTGLIQNSDPDIRRHAVLALEQCGTVKAVEKLLTLMNRTRNPFLKRDIITAVAGIQARLGNVGRGWLSEAQLDVLEGGLSDAEAEDELRGALSGSENSN